MRPRGRLFRRSGMMYVAVLGCALVVAVVGVSAIMVTRVEGRIMRGAADLAAARALATSSVDLGLWTLYKEPNWRTSKFQGAWRTNQAAGDGLISLSVVDPIDGLLGNAKWEPVIFTGTGTVREARYLLETTAIGQPHALPALNTVLHAGGSVTVGILKSISVTGAPLSMNGSINGPGTITGNVHAGSLGVLPIVIGTSTIPSPAKEMPDPGIFAMYKSMATTVVVGNSLDRTVISPTMSISGNTNPNGVYFIDAGSSDLTIKWSRINGTLLVKTAANRKLLLDDVLFLHAYRADYPVLIVDGNLEIALNSASTPLSESSLNKNFNPVGAPYLSVTDSDMTDSYPNEVQGLVHVSGTVTFGQTSRIRGVVISGGNVTVSGTAEIIHDPKLYSNPPMGYVTYSMQLAHGSWRRVVGP